MGATAEQLRAGIEQAVAAADAAATGEPGAVARALERLDALQQLQVSTALLMETQGGKAVRRLTKHQVPPVRQAATAVVAAWKGVVAAEAAAAAPQAEPGSSGAEVCAAAQAGQPGQPRPDEPNGASSQPPPKKQRLAPGGAAASASAPAPASSSRPVAAAQKPAAPLVIPKTGDAARDKIRGQLAEAIALAAADVPGGDAGARAAEIEAAVLAQQGGAANQKYKARIRSLWVNLKDAQNPDFRRSVLLGEISGEEAVGLRAEEMASRARQAENAAIREAALFEAERGKRRLATTDQFQCGRCKKRQTSYYQMQTRSADEPMTTFVICQVCDNRWKFC